MGQRVPRGKRDKKDGGGDRATASNSSAPKQFQKIVL